MSWWSGRLGEDGGGRAVPFTASLPFDNRLWPQDLAGSRAHARMLVRQGIISEADGEAIQRGLAAIEAELSGGTFPFRLEDEDIHLNIERRLTELIGPAGGRLHTARSRNDQVALDTHLYVRDEARAACKGIRALAGAIVGLAEANREAIAPGYTHLQRAQPVLLAHHLLAYFWMLVRDEARFAAVEASAMARLPLGAGALAGTSFPIDPAYVAAELGFTDLYANSIDAVADRDYVLEFLSAAAILMVHLSRLGEELVLWSTAEFAYITMAPGYVTSSSMMPQKKNPDVAELVRGKAGRVIGDLVGLLTVVKGLPLAYHSDLQEDKERLFDAADTLRAVLAVLPGLVSSLEVNRERLAAATRDGYLNATDLADRLAASGKPFREAHAAVGRIVAKAAAAGKRLEELSAADLEGISPADLTPEAAVAGRRSPMGTAPERVAEQLAAARRWLVNETPH